MTATKWVLLALVCAIDGPVLVFLVVFAVPYLWRETKAELRRNR